MIPHTPSACRRLSAQLAQARRINVDGREPLKGAGEGAPTLPARGPGDGGSGLVGPAGVDQELRILGQPVVVLVDDELCEGAEREEEPPPPTVFEMDDSFHWATVIGLRLP